MFRRGGRATDDSGSYGSNILNSKTHQYWRSSNKHVSATAPELIHEHSLSCGAGALAIDVLRQFRSTHTIAQHPCRTQLRSAAHSHSLRTIHRYSPHNTAVVM
ncbi:uncharacterized protein H6S33_012034 [Morchella sextelata]|uniref:uncharacterized protein n=1 Tax=Morchella sextelata TaxID=1174677 RepID=UPI001D039223|nr:uncharacterized protein H6S33_012034 [Morchella sextelata]KAH0610507.1 hypothetical protein H6S33_012034 [Morchella sextelata]